MFRKNFRLIIYLVLFSLLFALTFLFLTSKEHRQFVDALNLVPADASIVIRVPSIKKWMTFVKTSEIGQKFLRDKQRAEMMQGLEYIVDSIATPNNALRNSLNNSLVVSFVLINQELQPLFAINISEEASRFGFKDAMHNFLRKHQYKIKEENYDNQIISTFVQNSEEKFHAVLFYQTLLVSTSRIVIEQAVRQSKIGATLIFNKSFVDAQSTVGHHVEGNIYIRVESMYDQISKYLDKKFQNGAKAINLMGTWLSLDITLQNQAVYLTGYLYPNYKAPQSVKGFKLQPDRETRLSDGIPTSAPILLTVETQHFAKILAGNKTIQNSTTTEGKQFVSKNKTLSQQLGESPELFLEQLEIQSAGVVFTSFSDNVSENWVTVLQLKNTSQGETAFRKKIESFAAKSNEKIATYFITENARNLEPIKFYKNPFEGVISNNIGRIFGLCSEKYCIFIRDYLVFASSKQVLKDYAMNLYQNQTILRKPEKWSFSEVSKQPSSISLAINPSKVAWANIPFITTKLQKSLAESTFLSTLDLFSIQLRNSESDKMYCSVIILPKGQERTQNTTESSSEEQLQQLWETKVGYPVQNKPQIVKNFHTNQYQVWLQDINNRGIMLDRNGKEIWTYPLPEKISSTLSTIDYFRNGKLQYVFSTTSQIHLIDRFGRTVTPFPNNLPASSRMGISVFDYENNRDYRYVYCADNGTIYVLDKNGKPLEGFSSSISGKIIQPMNHLRIKGKDYITFCTTEYLYLLSRRGEQRLKVSVDNLGIRTGNIIFDTSNEKFTASTDEGELWQCSLKGTITTEKFPIGITKNHYLLPYQKKQRTHYLLCNKEKLYTLDPSLKIIVEKKIPFEITQQPEYITHKGRTYFLFYSESQAMVLNENLEILSGFPVNCTTPITASTLLHKDKLQFIIPTPNNTVLCYSID